MEEIDFFEKFNTFQRYYMELLKDNIYDNGNLASYIKMYYIQNNKILFHVSEILDLSVIVPKGNFDMYQKNFSEKVFATSNPYEIWLYACRAVLGEMHEKNRVCIYPDNPFLFFETGYYYLKRSVAVYVLNAEEFFPVIKVKSHFNENKNSFDNEWIANHNINPLYQYTIDRIPKEFTKYYDVYYLNNISNVVYPNSLEELRYFRKNNMVRKIE